jgi:hypothetical protein
LTEYRETFCAIVRDPQYLQGIAWGEPREGHPEGTIRAHIEDLERRLGTIRSRLVEDDYWKLQILIHTHDTFKGQAAEGAAIVDANSHASLARGFLASFCSDEDLLNMVQYHDEPYALWLQAQSKGEYDHDRMISLLATIADWDLFLTFAIIDGCSPGKSREPLRWLFGEVQGRVQTTITANDIL